MLIKFKTAQQICFCYDQIERAEEMLERCLEQIKINGALTWENHGRVTTMQLGIPSGFESTHILRVDQELSLKMIRKHIINKRLELKDLNILAYRELKTKTVKEKNKNA